jgi:hypothetical protein
MTTVPMEESDATWTTVPMEESEATWTTIPVVESGPTTTGEEGMAYNGYILSDPPLYSKVLDLRFAEVYNNWSDRRR